MGTHGFPSLVIIRLTAAVHYDRSLADQESQESQPSAVTALESASLATQQTTPDTSVLIIKQTRIKSLQIHLQSIRCKHLRESDGCWNAALLYKI